ncbi:MAG: GNAT family N-acetyltransferase [Verrucomicrobiales bacterium]|nr:GNAT family N-acetyltransferase [Verrucomicrobiales bacterium]
MSGRYCRLEPLSVSRHALDLHAASNHDPDPRFWTYLPYGPFAGFEAYSNWLTAQAPSTDPQFHAIVDAGTGKAVGLAAYLRITPAAGCIEVGHLNFFAPLRQSPAATECMFLMMARAFQLGYRRYEWKCDALNEPSRAAARRLGFSYEGLFRQAVVYKGRSRDTAWYSITDQDWTALQPAYQRWLDPSNFDRDGRQRLRLSTLTAPLRQSDNRLPKES